MKYILPQDRNQQELFSSLESKIPDNSFVRVLDVLVECIVDQNPTRFDPSLVSDQGGRPSYHPKTMLKLFLYGYFEGIKSSRKLEKASHRNLELMWLLGRLSPDFKTIADYRKNHKDQIKFVSVEFRRFLKDQDYIKGSHLKQDGSKFKANASRGMLNLKTIERSLEKAEEQLQKYLDQLQRNDTIEEALEDSCSPTLNEALLEQIEKLRRRIEELEAQESIVRQSEKTTLSLTDPEALQLKTRDGVVPGYNIQFLVDDENKMIAYAKVVDQANDMNQLEPALEGVKQELEIVPETLTADKGYYVPDQIQEIEKQSSTQCYVFVPEKSPKAKRDKEAGIYFTFDKENNHYICSQGKKLALRHRNKKKKNTFVDLYVGKECGPCPLREICTTSKKGRNIYRRHNKEWVEEYEQRMKQEDAKEILKTRGSVVEHPFGTIKILLGKIPLLLRGKAKVQTEINLITTIYNLKRLSNLEGTPTIIEMMKKYNWKVHQPRQKAA